MTMNYRILGGTGIEVSVYCLGTMVFGADGNPDHDDCIRIIHAALGQGINFVDTADMYGEPGGETEEIVGEALKGRRDDVVLATKVHFPMGEGRNRSGNSRRWILYEVEQSLRRLQTDWIDLYKVMGAAGQHVADPQRHAAGGGQGLHVPGGLMGLAEALPEYHVSISRPFLLVFLSAHRSQETSVPSRMR